MKTHTLALALTMIMVLSLVGTACAGEVSASTKTPVTTNVWFAKMIKTNNSYQFELLPTVYTGQNAYGRMMFVTGDTDIPTGDYAIIQLTRKGTELIKTLKLTKSGNVTTEFALLRLELNKEDLAEPLSVIDLAAPGTVSTPQTATPLTSPTALQTTPRAPSASATKAPVGIDVILTSLCIASLYGATRLRR